MTRVMATPGHLVFLCALAGCAPREVTVGSKKFTESVILGEAATQLVRASGVPARHRAQLGGTQVLWNALLAGEIDLYPEYTGTLAADVLKVSTDALPSALEARGVHMSRPLGFEDTYALGMREELAARLGIVTLSDLARHPELRVGLSEEFMNRADGWPRVREVYGVAPRELRALDHDLAYRALADGALDVVDLYSTDAEIRYYKLRVLADDRRVFPEYRAVLLWRDGRVAAAVARLEGAVDATAMIAMNARAKLDKIPEPQVAAQFLDEKLGVRGQARVEGLAESLARRTGEHLLLVVISLLAAVLLAIPLGILAARRPRLGQALLSVTGVVQTIPSLALLVFMIPLFGIGAPPAMVALFLYSLLPVVRNTHAGLVGISPSLIESAEALGLDARARLRLIELPLASPLILAGIKTAAIINVGTATLGAVIGAGGYGQPILTGIRLDDVGLILQGAIPAALLALLVQALFDGLERVVVPKGLRL